LAAVTFGLGLIAGGFISTAVTGQRASPAAATPPDTNAAAPTLTPTPTSTSTSTVGRYAVDVLRVIDGDTFEARVHVWPGFDLTTRVRLRGIDAPEMRARCGDERTRAEAALDALRAMLAERDVTVAAIGPDKYFGRVVADVSTRRTPDVSAALLAKGVARSYSGGRRESWCEARISG
jgi:endonuclease YncB( thermonuclease family)